MTDPAPGGGPLDVLERMLPLLRDKDLDALADLYTEDAVHELPFAPPGAPRRIEGRERIREYFSSTLAHVPLEFHAFHPVAVNPAADPQVVVAEYDAEGTALPTGRRFTVRYLWVLRVVDGRIAEWRDYWNPAEIIDLQG
ncbi:nuclear transport factor 2 family protein [Nocardiopsis sp. RSe5-2]|uniref:Nuclear transport factor 2 family protein n=1 Tax=Nocardiopsis endophytica TaxID=3018445 RepID=A0ABT4U1P9_9ACTN|nr:nuclear transport factor 2 family protein [Nocardiopsis endophytica]MDA2810863.1 nuclear transport factor 2 family protein [Nocardiopsis endophytica]